MRSKKKSNRQLPYKQFYVLHHAGDDLTKTAFGRLESTFKRTSQAKGMKQPDYKCYKPGVKYGLFSSLEAQSTSVVLLKKPMKGYLIEKYFQTEKSIKKHSKSLLQNGSVYKCAKIVNPVQHKVLVYEYAIKEPIQRIVQGENHTVIISTSNKVQKGSMLFNVNHDGILIQSYQELRNLSKIIRKSGRYGGCNVGVKVKGFIFYKGKKLDIFTLKNTFKSKNKTKSLKLNEFDEIVEFCKMARTSELSMRSLYKDHNVEKEMVTVVQLVFFVKDKLTKAKVLEGKINFVKACLTGKKNRKLAKDFQNYVMTSIVQNVSIEGCPWEEYEKNNFYTAFQDVFRNCSSVRAVLDLSTSQRHHMHNSKNLEFFNTIEKVIINALKKRQLNIKTEREKIPTREENRAMKLVNKESEEDELKKEVEEEIDQLINIIQTKGPNSLIDDQHFIQRIQKVWEIVQNDEYDLENNPEYFEKLFNLKNFADDATPDFEEAELEIQVNEGELSDTLEMKRCSTTGRTYKSNNINLRDNYGVKEVRNAPQMMNPMYGGYYKSSPLIEKSQTFRNNKISTGRKKTSVGSNIQSRESSLARIKTLNSKIRTLKNDFGLLSSPQIVHTGTEKKNSIHQMLEESAETIRKLKHLENENFKKENEIQKLTEDVKKLEELEHNLEAYQQENNTLQQELEKLKKINEKSVKEIETSKKNYTDRSAFQEKIVAELKSQTENYRREIEEIDRKLSQAEREKRRFKARAEELEEDLDLVEGKVGKVRDKLRTELEEVNRETENRIEKKERRIKELEDENSRLVDKLENAMNLVKIQNTKNVDFETSREITITENSSLKFQAEKLKDQNSQLKKELEELRNEMFIQRKNSSSARENQDLIMKQNKEIDYLKKSTQARIKKLNELYKNSLEDTKKTREELKNAKNKLKEKENTILEFEQQFAFIEEGLTKRTKKYENDVNSLSEDLSSLRIENKKLKNENYSLRTKFERQQASLEGFKEKNSQYKFENSNLKDQIEDIELRLSNYIDAKQKEMVNFSNGVPEPQIKTKIRALDDLQQLIDKHRNFLGVRKLSQA